MSREALRTLFHPYESGSLALPGQHERFLFIGAEPGFILPDGFAARLDLVQGFRPFHLRLVAAGYRVSPTVESDNFDGALVLCGRHRGQNQGWVAEALLKVVPGGPIAVAGTKEDGVGSLRRRLQAVLPLEGHLPKHHGIVLWLRRPPQAEADAAAAALRVPPVCVDGRFVTAPGMFSHDRIDPGSRLLAEHLPPTCRGAAADFGAGWGYLAAALAERTAGLERIDLYEADHASLEAARQNLSGLAGVPQLSFFWHDLVAEKVGRTYELVVMNPPFHQARAAEPGIGRAMIGAAATALRPGGRLLMVHNRGLPYERALQSAFPEVIELAADASFRVVQARR
jgi:16S rRNA (guanine1207-N2)-methyltransferase